MYKIPKNMQNIVKENKPEIALLCCVLLSVTLLGDKLVADFVATLPPKSLLRASDTVIHGLIAAASWRIVCILSPHLNFSACLPSCLNRSVESTIRQESPSLLSLISFYNMSLAFVVASAVDLDHVIINLYYMIQGHELPHWQRGLFHFVLPPFLFCIVLYLSSIVFKSLSCLKIAIFVFVCVIGHDIRDACHHGLWFQPLGVTPRFPYWLYVLSTMLLPFISGGLGFLAVRANIVYKSSISIV
ncbi:transmembrane protein 267 [Palaemon carinicauda]|uniref:transmembrane protein 267 n=1 Tax=Palaemon carinicauda TaxID=392227 RepID=UPI0035B5C7A0